MRLGGNFLLVLLATVGAANAQTFAVSAPGHDQTLRGGAYGLLRWSADKLPAGAEEWEAFLSIDGGAHYAFRITPHLDLALQRVSWLVPNVDAPDARILIRAGNEKDEHHFVLPVSFSIVRDGTSALLVQAMSTSRGEPARDGDEGVLQWAEGDRAGTRVTQVMNVIPPGRMDSLHTATIHDSPSAAAPKRARPFVESAPLKVRQFRSEQTICCRRFPVANILQLSHRQNI